MALGALMPSAVRADERVNNPLAVRKPHFENKAKAVIHLFMAGAPSQLELFDNKPVLTELSGKPLPPSVIGGQRGIRERPAQDLARHRRARQNR